MIEQDLQVTRGDHWTFESTNDLNPAIGVVDEDGVVVDISGSTLVFSVSKKSANLFAINDTVELADYEIRKSTADSDEMEITDGPNGIYQIKGIPADTQTLNTLEEGQEYLYDVQITTAAGRVKTLIGGNFIIKGDVSRPTA
jgi:hypothetical protein